MARDDAPEVQKAKAQANAQILSGVVQLFESLGTEGIKLLEKVLETAHSSAAMAFVLGMIVTHLASKTPNPFGPPEKRLVVMDIIENIVRSDIRPSEVSPNQTPLRFVVREVDFKPTILDDFTAGAIKTVLITGMGVGFGGEILEKLSGFIPLGGPRSDDLMKPSTQVLVLGEGADKALSTLLRKRP